MQSTSYTPKAIVYGEYHPASIPITIASGQVIAAGTVLGKITSSNLYTAYSAAATDGSQVPQGFSRHSIDTSSTGMNQASESAMYVMGGMLITANLTGVDALAIARLGLVQDTLLGVTRLVGNRGGSTSNRFVTPTFVNDVAYTVLLTDSYVVYTALTAGQVVNLPTAASAKYQEFTVQDGAGTAGTNALTITPNGSEHINGATTKVIGANYGAATFYSDGSNWFAR